MEVGPLEMEILGLLEDGEALPVREVQARLQRRGRELAYTTVMTVLRRLHDKGAVGRVEDGRRHLYRLAAPARPVKRGLLDTVRERLFGGRRTDAVIALLDDEAWSAGELEELRRIVDDKLKRRKKGGR